MSDNALLEMIFSPANQNVVQGSFIEVDQVSQEDAAVCKANCNGQCVGISQ